MRESLPVWMSFYGFRVYVWLKFGGKKWHASLFIVLEQLHSLHCKLHAAAAIASKLPTSKCQVLAEYR